MNPNRVLAVVSVGGVVLLAVGALVGGLLGWPASTAGTGGVKLSVPAAVIVAALLVGTVAAAVVWGVRTAPGEDDTPYWNS